MLSIAGLRALMFKNVSVTASAAPRPAIFMPTAGASDVAAPTSALMAWLRRSS